MDKKVARSIIKSINLLKLGKYSILGSLFNKKRIANVCMFHLGRCGSTVISNMLNQNGDIYWDGEIFENYRKYKLIEQKFISNPLGILKIRINKQNTRYYGFEIKPYVEQHLNAKLLNVPLTKLINVLTALKVNKFIVIKRENYLKQLISFEMARLNKRHHYKIDEKTPSKKINLPIDNIQLGFSTKTLYETLVYYDSIYKSLESQLIDKDVLYISYEKDIEQDPNIAYRKIVNFLKIDYIQPKITIKKINKKSVKESLLNYEEVRKKLENTSYDYMLNS